MEETQQKLASLKIEDEKEHEIPQDFHAEIDKFA